MNDLQNNKELVAAGHEFARLMSSDTAIIEIAKMVTRLAERLDCTTAALRAMQSERDHLAAQLADVVAENAGLLSKAASELSNAWVLHKYLIGIQAAIMYLDNGNKKAAQEWLYGTIAGPGFEFPDEVEDIDAWATHQMRGSISHPRALEIIKAETPATDRFLAEQRASAIPEGYALVPQQIFLDPSDIESICSQCGDGRVRGTVILLTGCCGWATFNVTMAALCMACISHQQIIQRKAV